MQVNHKRKLNMLEPGTKMCAAITILLASSIVFFQLHIEIVSIFLIVTAGMVFILLITLLIIEHRQDEKQYLEAKKENSEIK